MRAELLTQGSADGSHDLEHLQRVSPLGRRFAKEEPANELVVHAAGMLHDIVNLAGDKLSGHLMIALAFRRAGQMNLPLFHLKDPFAEKGRTINSSYALDLLLSSDNMYVRKFIDQLRFELNGYQPLTPTV